MTTQIELAAREAAFQKHLSNREAYHAAIIAQGDTPKEPWHHGDVDLQRDLWMRRYERPAPPVGLHTDLSVIRGDDRLWSSVEAGEVQGIAA